MSGQIEDGLTAAARAELHSGPTPTALAAKAFMERVGGPVYARTIETRAVLGGWSGARSAGCFDVKLSDAIATAAVSAVMDLFRSWAAEANQEPQAGAEEPGGQLEHLRQHLSDGRWHDGCRWCLRRRVHGGTGLEPCTKQGCYAHP